MKRKMRCAAVLIAVMVAFSMTLPVQAASKKTVSVCTKIKHVEYDDEDGDIDATAKYTYMANGLLKSLKMSVMSGIATGKYKYTYGKKSRIKKQRYTTYFFGEKVGSGSAKYVYTKKGYLKKHTSYNKNGKKTGATKLKRNKKGYVTKAKDYNAKGKVKETRKYTLDANGDVLKKRVYNAKGKLKETENYTHTANQCTIQTYNAKGKLTTTRVEKYAHGDIVSATEYDETKGHKKTGHTKYWYKKVTTKKHSAVKKQQQDLGEFL